MKHRMFCLLELGLGKVYTVIYKIGPPQIFRFKTNVQVQIGGRGLFKIELMGDKSIMANGGRIALNNNSYIN